MYKNKTKIMFSKIYWLKNYNVHIILLLFIFNLIVCFGRKGAGSVPVSIGPFPIMFLFFLPVNIHRVLKLKPSLKWKS